VAGNSVAQLISPLLAKQDVMAYNRSLRLLRMAEKYGKNFLNSHGLKWIQDKKLRAEITDIVIERLIWHYPDHNFAICRDEVDNDLLLHVIHAEDVPYWDELWKKFDGMIGKNKEKEISFLTV
jgi:hypothetical protein